MGKYGLNKVELIGNLGQDPEVRYTDKGVMYANISLACTERFRDKEGNYVDRTEWVRVTLWRGQADIASKFLRKGSTVFVEGRLRNSSWETPQGEKRSRIDIEAVKMILLDSRPPQAGVQQPPMHTPINQNQAGIPAQPGQNQQTHTLDNQKHIQNNQGPAIEDSGDDDLPF